MVVNWITQTHEQSNGKELCRADSETSDILLRTLPLDTPVYVSSVRPTSHLLLLLHEPALLAPTVIGWRNSCRIDRMNNPRSYAVEEGFAVDKISSSFSDALTEEYLYRLA